MGKGEDDSERVDSRHERIFTWSTVLGEEETGEEDSFYESSCDDVRDDNPVFKRYLSDFKLVEERSRRRRLEDCPKTLKSTHLCPATGHRKDFGRRNGC